MTGALAGRAARRTRRIVRFVALILVPRLAATAQQPTVPSASGRELCSPAPEQPAKLTGPDGAERLAGTYTLVVVDRANRIASGNLQLMPTDSAHRYTRIPNWLFPLRGAADVHLDTFGRVSVAYSPSTLSADRPGVQTIYDRRDGSLKLVFGAAVGDSGGYADAGVFFTVSAIDSSGFAGRWRDGGLAPEVLGGYFCARRVRRSGN